MLASAINLVLLSPSELSLELSSGLAMSFFRPTLDVTGRKSTHRKHRASLVHKMVWPSSLRFLFQTNPTKNDQNKTKKKGKGTQSLFAQMYVLLLICSFLHSVYKPCLRSVVPVKTYNDDFSNVNSVGLLVIRLKHKFPAKQGSSRQG